MANTKQVVQLNDSNVFVGVALAKESPLEPGVYHLPRNCIDVAVPEVQEGFDAVWTGSEWQYVERIVDTRTFEEKVAEEIAAARAEEVANRTWDEQRAFAYPTIGDQLDDLFHAGYFSAEMSAKIQAVKDSIPKPE